MEVKVFNHGRSCHVDGIYSDGEIVVYKGGKIFADCNSKFSKYAEAFEMRNDPEIVNKDGVILKDCTFKTPSAAAVFVAGSSRNGNDFWKVAAGVSLGKHLEELGVRERRKRSK